MSTSYNYVKESYGSCKGGRFKTEVNVPRSQSANRERISDKTRSKKKPALFSISSDQSFGLSHSSALATMCTLSTRNNELGFQTSPVSCVQKVFTLVD